MTLKQVAIKKLSNVYFHIQKFRVKLLTSSFKVPFINTVKMILFNGSVNGHKVMNMFCIKGFM